jgi:hypothetical protein
VAVAVADVDTKTPTMGLQNLFLNVTWILYYSVPSVILRRRSYQVALELLNSAVLAQTFQSRPNFTAE